MHFPKITTFFTENLAENLRYRRRTELTQKFRKFDNIHRKGTFKSELSIVKDDLKEAAFFVCLLSCPRITVKIADISVVEVTDPVGDSCCIICCYLCVSQFPQPLNFKQDKQGKELMLDVFVHVTYEGTLGAIQSCPERKFISSSKFLLCKIHLRSSFSDSATIYSTKQLLQRRFLELPLNKAG